MAETHLSAFSSEGISFVSVRKEHSTGEFNVAESYKSYNDAEFYSDTQSL